MHLSAEQLMLLQQLDNVRTMLAIVLTVTLVGSLVALLVIAGLASPPSTISSKEVNKACKVTLYIMLSSLVWIAGLVFVPSTEEVLRAVCLSQIVDIKDPDELRAAHARALELTRLLLLQRPDPPKQQQKQENKEKTDGMLQ